MEKVKLKEFINEFEIFLKKYPNEKVSMSQHLYYGCGMPACFGGWMHAILGKRYDFSMNDAMNYNDGASMLAEFLGFEDYEKLKIWARYNPEIWGNDYGESMFSLPAAFEEREKNYDYKNLNLSDILYKWKKVYERLNEQSKT